MASKTLDLKEGLKSVIMESYEAEFDIKTFISQAHFMCLD